MTMQIEAEAQPEADTQLMKVRGMSMSYGSGATENKILENLNLDVAAGEFISIVGPSGVGKTTLLRCLSGLLRPKAGTIEVGGSVISGPHPDLAVVFQDYSRSLMPWMTTRDNVAFPLQGKGMGKAERNRVADENLAARGPERPRGQIPLGDVRRHAAARGHRPCAGLQRQGLADG